MLSYLCQICRHTVRVVFVRARIWSATHSREASRWWRDDVARRRSAPAADRCTPSSAAASTRKHARTHAVEMCRHVKNTRCRHSMNIHVHVCHAKNTELLFCFVVFRRDVFCVKLAWLNNYIHVILISKSRICWNKLKKYIRRSTYFIYKILKWHINVEHM